MREPTGKVYLVGAGPGEAGLLTIKGKQLIEKADILIYDQLVCDDILRLAPSSCELIFVGKSPGRHYRLQEEINDLLVEKGLAGGIVVRLKGGDPFVFGRGGEEALALRKHEIDFEIVPGVSSAYAVTAGDTLMLKGMVLSLDGQKVVKVEASGANPDLTGKQAAEEALKQGAAQVIDSCMPGVC